MGAIMRSLLVEDDSSLLALWTDAFIEAGHSVIACETLDAGMQHLRMNTFDVIVVDLMLGRQNSLSFIEFASYAAPNAAVILVTGSDIGPRGELFQMSRNLSFILRKPVKICDLLNVMNHSVRKMSHLEVL